MKKFVFVSALSVTLLSLGCGPSAAEKAAKEKAYMDSIEITNAAGGSGNQFISSSSAVVDKRDTTHKFIRTADLKFKVKDVIRSTYDIESIAKSQEGFVTYTNLTSHVDYTDNTLVSADSTLETTYFTVSNNLILRVPNTKLDTTLKVIAKHIDFLDYRIIKADDVALDVLSNTLQQKRSERNEERITKAIDERGKKLKETTSAEELLYAKQTSADEARISNMRLADQINFSTINLNIYQRQTFKRELLANTKNIDAYEPGIGYQLKEAFKWGWEALKTVLITLVKLWWLIVCAIVAYLFYKRFRNKEL